MSPLAWISVGLLACGASYGGGTPSQGSVPAERTQATSTRDLVREAVLAIEQRGALYLSDGDRCEEWEAGIEDTLIYLVRYWYPSADASGKVLRSRQSRTIQVASEGLALMASREWVNEEFVKSTQTWRNLSGKAGSDLCVADPVIRRVKDDLHYSIGGAEIYLTRRACEDDRSRDNVTHTKAAMNCSETN